MKVILFGLLLSIHSLLIFACSDYEINHIGNLQEAELKETSGIASSRKFPGIIWAHNDSGDSARFFAMTWEGKRRGEFSIKGATHKDWEDMAIASCPSVFKIKGKDCLYFGDIGDNPFKRDTLEIFVLQEPEPSIAHKKLEVDLLIKYTVKLDTKPRNFETLMVDGDKLVLISKSDARAGKQYKEEGLSHIYTFDMEKEKNVMAKKISSFNFFDLAEFKGVDGKEKWQNHFGWLTGGDYDPVKKNLVLLTYGMVLEFKVQNNWKTFIPQKPYALPDMPQAESVAYLNDGSMMVISEYAYQPIYQIKCKSRGK